MAPNHTAPKTHDAGQSRSAQPTITAKSTSAGDADPSNVSLLVHGAEMLVAQTRAVNRALRKAYG
jgi:hypothetical protein